MAKKEIQKREERTYIRSLSNICEEDGKILLRLEMPGVTREAVNLKIENNELHIIGKRSEPQTKDSYLIKERRDGDYYHAYTLDDTVDQNSIEATMEAGILIITLRLKAEVTPKQIEIKVGS